MMKEENCIVLDFLPHGYADRRHAEPVAQAVGTSFFTLLEVIPREGTDFAQGESVYIGEGKREKVMFIKGQIKPDDLTRNALFYLSWLQSRRKSSLLNLRTDDPEIKKCIKICCLVIES